MNAYLCLLVRWMLPVVLRERYVTFTAYHQRQ